MSECEDSRSRPTGQATRNPEQFQRSAAADPQRRRPSHHVEQAQTELDALMAAVTGLNLYLDKVEIPVNERPREALFDDLREHAREVFWLPERLREWSAVAERPDCPAHLQRFRGIPYWWPAYRKVTIIVPDKTAAHIIADQGWRRPNRAEVSIDYIFATDQEAARMREFHDRFGVQLRHGKRCLDASGTVSYTGRPKPGRYTAAYADRVSKPTGETSTCHIDIRFHGNRAVRDSLGIITNADLLSFDFDGFRAKFERYEVIDLEVLGRSDDNHCSGKRRQKPHLHRFGNVDLRRGGFLWRVYGGHPKLPLNATQQFLDQYRLGRGSYLHRLNTDACTVTPSIDNGVQFASSCPKHWKTTTKPV